MEKGKPIEIISAPQKELSTSVVIGGKKKYLVITDDLGSQRHLISTRVYLGGEIILAREIDYKYLLNSPDLGKWLKEIMQEQHEIAIHMLKTESTKKKPSDYLDEVKVLLQGKNNRSALRQLIVALEQYPNEPFLLSYYGCLEAIVNKNYDYGIYNCSKAIEVLREKIPFGHEFFYPIFYLNLGRAYLASGNKKNAIKTFHKGLAYDGENEELLKEIKTLGVRRKTVVPFLPRSHPINKYIGVLLHRFRI